MKRILMVGMLCAVSMFFTGCSSLDSLTLKSYDYIKMDVIKDSKDKEALEEALGEIKETVPDYYELNDEEQEAYNINRAFKFADGHSDDLKEIVSFDVVTMLDNGTFIYTYSTKKENSDDVYVHCVAAYQYEKKKAKYIHQTEFKRSEISEDSEEIYAQLCSGEQVSGRRLFVYDNGIGHLYDMDELYSIANWENETLPSVPCSFEADIKATVNTYFSKAYEVSVTNAMSDGNERFYVELSIEKSEIGAKDQNGNSNIEDMSEEDAEKEVGDKVIEIVLAYDFNELARANTIDQVKLNHDAQVEKWKQMTSGKTYTEAPNAEADWQTVCSSTLKSQWSIAFIDGMQIDGDAKSWLQSCGVDYNAVKDLGMPVFTWNSTPSKDSFQYSDDGYVCTFKPKSGQYKGFTSLNANSELTNIFVPKYGKYYEIHGNTETILYYSGVTITREYTFEYKTGEKDEQGNDIVATEKKEQSLYVCKKRYSYISAGSGVNGYLEGYGTLASLGISDMKGSAYSKMFCQKKDGEDKMKLYWLTEDWKLESAELTVSDTAMTDLAYMDQSLYYLISTEAGLDAKKVGYNSSKKKWSIDTTWTIDQAVLNTEEMSIEEERSSENKTIENSTWEEITNRQILKTSIQSNAEALQKLKAEGVDTSKYKIDGEGFLLTTSRRGLIFYSPGEKRAINLNAGTWYGTWKKGSKLVSIGFEKNDPYYNTTSSDLVNARIMEYDLNELYKKALETFETEVTAKNKKEQDKKNQEIRESIEESSIAEENRETVEDMQDTWEKYKETRATKSVDELLKEMESQETTADTGKTNK